MSSIEKMMFADIAGVDSDLDAVLDIISSCGCFHMENAAVAHSSQSKAAPKRENPYTSTLKMMSEIFGITGIKPHQADCSDIHDSDADKIRDEVHTMRNNLQKLRAEQKKAEEEYSSHTMALEQVMHLSGGEEIGRAHV